MFPFSEQTAVDIASSEGVNCRVLLGRYKSLSARGRAGGRRHTRLLTLVLPLKGAFPFVLGETAHQVRPGQVLRILPDTPYRLDTSTLPRGELAWMMLGPVPPPGRDSLPRAVEVLADSRGPVVWRVPAQVQASWEAAFGLVKDARDWIGESLLAHALAECVFLLVRSFHAADRTVPVAYSRRVGRALDWLDAHLGESCTVAELARAAGLSERQFHGVFRSETGTTPRDFVLRRKIEHARALLESNPACDITAVAHALGFSSSQYFATVFRRYQGMSPSQLRHGTCTR
ncbi:helix-turn-helix domain-containing protein [Streptoverticillium reticulum]|uniref:AraC family transcriptional regulator n=1 Tax=Streptoverticillium reticulum TaxID=1433415 RepID=UPI0039BFD1D0